MGVQEFGAFICAVDPTTFWDYYCFVPAPMYLSLLQARMTSGYYRQADALVHDIRLLHSNCCLYNVEDSTICHTSLRLVTALEHAIFAGGEDPVMDALEEKLEALAGDGDGEGGGGEGGGGGGGDARPSLRRPSRRLRVKVGLEAGHVPIAPMHTAPQHAAAAASSSGSSSSSSHAMSNGADGGQSRGQGQGHHASATTTATATATGSGRDGRKRRREESWATEAEAPVPVRVARRSSVAGGGGGVSVAVAPSRRPTGKVGAKATNSNSSNSSSSRGGRARTVSKYVDRGSSDSDLMSDEEREAAEGGWAPGPRRGGSTSASQQKRLDVDEDEDEDGDGGVGGEEAEEEEAEELEKALRMVAEMERKEKKEQQQRRRDKGTTAAAAARSVDDGDEEEEEVVEEEEEKEKEQQQQQRHRLDPDTKRVLLDILALLQSEDGEEIFARPVNPDDAPGYGLLVKRPMDLGTVRTKLQSRLYAGPADLATDVRLCFDNCLAYNEPSSYYAEEAKRLRQVLDRELMAAGY